jgi:hypothetical protein
VQDDGNPELGDPRKDGFRVLGGNRLARDVGVHAHSAQALVGDRLVEDGQSRCRILQRQHAQAYEAFVVRALRSRDFGVDQPRDPGRLGRL